MNWSHIIFGVASAIVILFGNVEYALHTYRRRVQPCGITWILWTLTTWIVLFNLIASHAGMMIIVPLVLAPIDALVVILAFSRGVAVWEWRRSNLICALIVMLAMTFWLMTGDPVIAISMCVLADFIATSPTVVKILRSPETEDPTYFFLQSFGYVLLLLSTSEWTTSHVLYATYAAVFYAAIFIAIRFRVGPRIAPDIKKSLSDRHHSPSRYRVAQSPPAQ
jgi:hypothetical protein